jgi:hypothetical protein
LCSLVSTNVLKKHIISACRVEVCCIMVAYH